MWRRDKHDLHGGLKGSYDVDQHLNARCHTLSLTVDGWLEVIGPEHDHSQVEWSVARQQQRQDLCAIQIGAAVRIIISRCPAAKPFSYNVRKPLQSGLKDIGPPVIEFVPLARARVRTTR